MKARMLRDYYDIFSGNLAKKNEVFEIIEDKKEFDFVKGQFSMNFDGALKRNGMAIISIWRCDLKKINVLDE